MMQDISEFRYRSLPRALLRVQRNVTEIPYGFFDSIQKTSINSPRQGHRKYQSESHKYSKSNLNSFTPDPYIISFKSEIQKALNYIKKNPVAKAKAPVERLPTLRYRNRDELAIKNFIESLFSNRPSPYKKSSIQDNESNTDTISAEKILLEAKKIITHGIKKKPAETGEKLNSLEYFWKTFISKDKMVRWDIFEDNFVTFISSYMILDFGIIRKLNWRVFLGKIYSNACTESTGYNFWISSPSFSILPAMNHRVLTLKDFCSLFESQEVVKLLHSCVDDLGLGPIRHREDVEYKYSCGCAYRGQWKEGKREGTGVLDLCSKERYRGIFLKGLFHDFGSLQALGLSYKGYFRKDKLHGFGKIAYPNGSFFEGVLDKGQILHGALKWANGKAYEGEFVNGEFEGKGTLVSSYGEISQGLWSKGKLSGECLVSTGNGYKLKGVFVDGVLSGRGKLTCSEYKSRGEFVESKPSGKGRFQFASGIWYEGEVREGKIDGFGIMKYPSGEVYEGFFVNSEQSGVGKITYTDGRVYEGQVDSGKPSGTGIFVYPQGGLLEKYEGEVKNGEIEGNGEAWFADKGRYKGQWANGSLEGIGLWQRDGVSYEGEITNGLFHGYGKLTIGSAFYSGLWTHGKPDGKGDAKDSKDTFYTGMFKDGAPVLKSKIDKGFLQLVCSFKLM